MSVSFERCINQTNSGYGTGGIMTDFGGGMPHFGAYLSQQEISEIVAYERTL